MFFQRTGLQRLTRQLGASIFLLLLFCGTNIQAKEPTPEIEVFVRAGCPHCETAKAFLNELQQERPAVRIVLYDIAEDSTARQRRATLAAERGIANIGVPTFLIGAELIVGFLSAETTGSEIYARLDQRAPGAEPPAAVASIQTKWFGELRVRNLGLPLVTIVSGLVDGLNPCSMWVLLFMLSLLAGLANRPKVLLMAGTFVAVEGIAYFAFMAAWLNLFLLSGLSRITELILGRIAGLAGAINIKDFWAFQRGISLSIPDAAKPGLYARMRRITLAENITATLLGDRDTCLAGASCRMTIHGWAVCSLHPLSDDAAA